MDLMERADELRPGLRPGCQVYRRAGSPFVGGPVSGRRRQALLPPAAHAVVRLCDGRHSVTSIIDHVADTLGTEMRRDRARYLVSQVLLRFRSFLELETDGVSPPTPVDGEATLVGGAKPSGGGEEGFISDEETLPGAVEALDGLSVLFWYATGRCERNCLYCNARTHWWWGLDPEPAGGAMARFVAAAAEAGVARLMLSGGEPLLHPDIWDVLAAACEGGMDTFVTTKHAFNDRELVRLADTGLERLTLSLDAPGATGDRLVGAGYVEGCLRTAERLARQGIWVTLAAVATRWNQDELPALAETALDCGAGELQVYTFMPTGRGCDSELELRPEDRRRLRDTLRRLAVDFEGRLLVTTGLGDEGDRLRRLARVTGRAGGCASALGSMVVLPNGRITRCEQLTLDGVIIGDVRTQSPLDVWCGEPGRTLRHPPREAFQGTPCRDCEEFDQCDARGRCVRDAHARWGRLFAPDRLCIRGGDGRGE